MRVKRTVALLGALAALGFASTASATSVSFVWVGGATPSVTAGVDLGQTLTLGQVGSMLFLDVRVTAMPDADPNFSGVNLASVSAAFDNSLLEAVSVVECPAAPGNGFAGFCGFPPVPGDASLGAVDAFDVRNDLGEVQTVAAIGVGLGVGNSSNVTFTVARIKFNVLAASATTVDGFYRTGVDGIVPSAGGNLFFPAVSGASIIPEPGTFALVGLGLGALAFAGRRR